MLSPSERIEVRVLQPMVAAWVLRASTALAAVLLASVTATLCAAVMALQAEPRVWAVMPAGQSIQVEPLRQARVLESARRHLDVLAVTSEAR